MQSNLVVIGGTNIVNMLIAHNNGMIDKKTVTGGIVIELFWWLLINGICSFFIFRTLSKKIARLFNETGLQIFIKKLVYYSLGFIAILACYDSAVNTYYALSNQQNANLSLTLQATVIVNSIYGSIFLPIFFTYILLNLYIHQLTRYIFRQTTVSLLPGKLKITRELFVVFFIISILPTLQFILELSHYGYFSNFTADKLFFITFIFQITVSIIITLIFFSQQLSRPLETILMALKKVEIGDYQVHLPVTTINDVGRLTHGFNRMIQGIRERELIKDTFGKYMSPEVVNKVLANKNASILSEERVCTIFFSDIKDYTSISEALSPVEIVDMLNEYFTDAVSIINQHQGIVNKYIGDAILAIFNAPLDNEDHAHHAVCAAQEIIALTEQKRYGKNIHISTRIGINTGNVVVGNIGSRDKLEYTVIGDNVNIAQRLEAYNKTTKTNILLSEATYQQLQHRKRAKIWSHFSTNYGQSFCKL